MDAMTMLKAAALALACAATQAIAGPAEEDFQRRSSAAGVIRAMGFDTEVQMAPYIFPDGNFERSGSGFDANNKASGGGSLHFVIPSNSGSSSSGSWRMNFSDARDVVIGSGQDLYVQWRQRFDTNFLATQFAGSGGWKQMILGEGDEPGSLLEAGSCSELEVVVQNTFQRGFTQMYHNCGVYRGFEEAYGAYDFKLQNKMPSPYCLYSSKAGCFMYYPNEWMTFQVHIRPGPRGTATSSLEGTTVTGFTNSLVELWLARDGKPSQLAMSWSGVVLHESSGKGYAKVWLLPYQTGKDASQTHPVGHTWYDELIISRSKIADPGVAAAPSPNPPTNVQAN